MSMAPEDRRIFELFAERVRELEPRSVATKQRSTWLHGAFEARLAADHGKVPLDFPAVAKATLENAQQFMAQIRTVLLQTTDPPPLG